MNTVEKTETNDEHKESQINDFNHDMNCEGNVEESLQNWFSLELIKFLIIIKQKIYLFYEE